MNFVQNEHVKLKETCIGTQSSFKENRSNVMDVVGHLTSKIHETLHTAYKHNSNSFNDLIT